MHSDRHILTVNPGLVDGRVVWVLLVRSMLHRQLRFHEVLCNSVASSRTQFAALVSLPWRGRCRRFLFSVEAAILTSGLGHSKSISPPRSSLSVNSPPHRLLPANFLLESSQNYLTADAVLDCLGKTQSFPVLSSGSQPYHRFLPDMSTCPSDLPGSVATLRYV